MFFWGLLYSFSHVVFLTRVKSIDLKNQAMKSSVYCSGTTARSQDCIYALCMCEQGGGGLSVYVMEELLLFPAKSEEQRRKGTDEWRRWGSTRDRKIWVGESHYYSHTHAHVHNIQWLPSPTACTSTPWGKSSNRRAFRCIHNMDVLHSHEWRAAEKHVGGWAPTEEHSFSHNAAPAPHHKEPSSYLSISAICAQQNETVR